LGSATDNIDVVNNEDGSVTIYLACHPNAIKFMIHAAVENTTSPSQVFRLHVNKNNNVVVEQPFMSNGEDLSASSVAAYYDHKVLIGAVYDDHFLVCNE
jgi:arylesterase/paraoxonase